MLRNGSHCSRSGTCRGTTPPEVLKKDVLSESPLLNRLLSRFEAATRIDRRLKQADMTIRVGTFASFPLASVFAGIVAGKIFHWPAIISCRRRRGVLMFVPNIVIDAERRRRFKRFMIHFPEALEMFRPILRAGHSFTGAIQLRRPGDAAPDRTRVLQGGSRAEPWDPLRQALLGMAERIESLDVKFFVTAILIQRETGGNLAEIIDKIGHVIRERFPDPRGSSRSYGPGANCPVSFSRCFRIGIAVLVGMLNPEYLKPLWFERTGKS